MEYYGKIEDTMTMLETGKTVGQIAGRQELHNMSFNAFLNHPLLGTNKGSDIGGHAYFMDRAGLLGLVGFIPLFLFFYNQIKITYENLPNSIRMYYLIGVVACIVHACKSETYLLNNVKNIKNKSNTGIIKNIF